MRSNAQASTLTYPMPPQVAVYPSSPVIPNAQPFRAHGRTVSESFFNLSLNSAPAASLPVSGPRESVRTASASSSPAFLPSNLSNNSPSPPTSGERRGSNLAPQTAHSRPSSALQSSSTPKDREHRTHSRHGSGEPTSSSSSSSTQPKLALHQPNQEDLNTMRDSAATDPVKKVKWAKEVFRYLERNQSGGSISDSRLVGWVDEAVKAVLASASSMPPIPEALYLRADLAMSGTCVLVPLLLF